LAKILLVEDDVQLASKLKDWFAQDGHLLEVAVNGEDALQLLSGFTYEILLLDWTLPGISGLDVCKSYRQSGGLANIIFLTGRGDIGDKEEALNYGADDYVTKPFDIRELAARVRSVLRRPYSLLPNELKVNGLVLDLKLNTIKCSDKEEHLTNKEVTLLEFLMRNPNRIYSSQELAKLLWPADNDTTAETVRSWMRNLRTKIGSVTDNQIIKTIPKSGYLIEVTLP